MTKQRPPAFEFADKVLRENMLTVGRVYCAAETARTGREVTLKTLGERAIRDHRFFLRLEENDGTFQASKADQVMCWLSAKFPEGATWPARVPRPSKKQFEQVLQQAAE